jgi:hypothetical protein
MNKAILQIWEESSIDNNILPVGGTLHIDIKERNKYVNKMYEGRDLNQIPNNYERISGSEVEVLINDSIFNILLQKKTVRLEEYELNNLVNMNEIIAENDYNLSVSSYVVAKDNREYVDIQELNIEISSTVKKINSLRADIDEIINEIEL